MTKTAFIAIVGKPNVGKSSLLNALVGEKISIVSFRPQTTRTRITGILTKEDTQFVFLDTPGLLKAKNRLGDEMVKAVKNSVLDVDAAILMVEPDVELRKAEQELIENFKKSNMPVILAINKIDTVNDKRELMSTIEMYSKLYDFSAIIPISALKNDGVDVLLEELDKFTVDSVHFFPDDAITDQPERIIASEIVREKLLINMRDEIPHGTAVLTEEMKEERGCLHISCVIYCERKNHKGMIIGKGGQMLKKIGTQARIEMEEFFGCKVDLRCWVKVKEDWRNRDNLLRSLGFSDSN